MTATPTPRSHGSVHVIGNKNESARLYCHKLLSSVAENPLSAFSPCAALVLRELQEISCACARCASNRRCCSNTLCIAFRCCTIESLKCAVHDILVTLVLTVARSPFTRFYTLPLDGAHLVERGR